MDFFRCEKGKGPKDWSHAFLGLQKNPQFLQFWYCSVWVVWFLYLSIFQFRMKVKLKFMLIKLFNKFKNVNKLIIRLFSIRNNRDYKRGVIYDKF